MYLLTSKKFNFCLTSPQNISPKVLEIIMFLANGRCAFVFFLVSSHYDLTLTEASEASNILDESSLCTWSNFGREKSSLFFFFFFHFLGELVLIWFTRDWLVKDTLQQHEFVLVSVAESDHRESKIWGTGAVRSWSRGDSSPSRVSGPSGSCTVIGGYNQSPFQLMVRCSLALSLALAATNQHVMEESENQFNNGSVEVQQYPQRDVEIVQLLYNTLSAEPSW